MKIKVLQVQVPMNVSRNGKMIKVKEYHQTRRGLKKNPKFDWFKKFPHKVKEIDV